MRSVIEYMTQMAATAPAYDLGANHPVAPIFPDLHCLGHRRRVERGPTRSGVELRLGVKEHGVAAGTPVGPVVMVVDVLAGERPLGAGFAKDGVLLGAQPFLPLLVGGGDVGYGLLTVFGHNRNCDAGAAEYGRGSLGKHAVMHDPRLEDHALGLELQLAELFDQAERARVQGRTADVERIQAEMQRLQEELAETAEKVATEEGPEVDVDAPVAGTGLS